MVRNPTRNRRPRFTRLAAATALALMAWPGLAVAGDKTGSSDWKGEARDAWLDGRIEAAFALNEHLNPFDIDTRVEGGEVKLSGSVESQIDKDLAAEVARSVSGVSRVDNALEVQPDTARDRKSDDEDRDLAGRVSDATTTARVKMALLGNQSTSGLAINVDTERGVVMLKGEVDSEQEGDLAEQIASNTEGVSRVENQLRTKSDS